MPGGTQGYNKRASLLSVCSPFGVPCQAASFIFFSQCSYPCSSCHPLFSVRLSWAMRLVTVGTRAQPSPSCLLICVTKDVAAVMWSSSSLVMVLGQNTHRIFRRHLFWKVTGLCVSLAVSFQHSEPYRSTLRTLRLHSLNFVFNFSCLEFQMGFSIMKGWLSFLILDLAYFESSSVVILLPMYATY